MSFTCQTCYVIASLVELDTSPFLVQRFPHLVWITQVHNLLIDAKSRLGMACIAGALKKTTQHALCNKTSYKVLKV